MHSACNDTSLGLVLVDAPLSPFFSQNLTREDLDAMNIEMSRLVSTNSS